MLQMNVQTITLLIALLSLVCFFGTMYGIQKLIKQGKDPGKQLATADSIVDTAVGANMALKTFIPAPIESIIDTVLKVTQTGVHSAQQLYNSGQLPPDLRKQQATDYAVNMIKLTGREVTPELEQTIRDTAEAAVYVMKQNDPVAVPVADPVQVIAPIEAIPTPETTPEMTTDQTDTTQTQTTVGAPRPATDPISQPA